MAEPSMPPIPDKIEFSVHTEGGTTVRYDHSADPYCFEVVQGLSERILLSRAGARELALLLEYLLDDIAPDPEPP